MNSNMKPVLGSQLRPGNLLTDGLVADYLFQEGCGNQIRDLSGNSNHGTFAVGAASPSWVGGKFGSAINFDGGDYIIIPDAPSLNPVNAVTVSAWIYATSLPNSYNHAVSKWYSGTADRGIGFGVRSTGKIDWNLTSDGGALESSAGDVVVNNWYHIVGTYDRINSKIYKNGVQVATRTLTAAIPQLTCPLHIGTDSQTPGSYWNGYIDNIQIWNRALSANEVQQLYLEPFARYMPTHTSIYLPQVYTIETRLIPVKLNWDLTSGQVIGWDGTNWTNITV